VYGSNIILCTCWPVPLYHSSLLSQTLSCRCLSHVAFRPKLSLHCHQTIGLVKSFDNKHTHLQVVRHLAQWACNLLTFKHPVVPPFTFPTSGARFKLLRVLLNTVYVGLYSVTHVYTAPTGQDTTNNDVSWGVRRILYYRWHYFTNANWTGSSTVETNEGSPFMANYELCSGARTSVCIFLHGKFYVKNPSTVTFPIII
jgi:hypothetical protein